MSFIQKPKLPSPISGVAMVLIVISLGALLIGIVSTTPATLGVGFICVACYLAILARIEQAQRIARRWELVFKDSNQAPDSKPKQEEA